MNERTSKQANGLTIPGTSFYLPLYFPPSLSPLIRMAQAIADADFDAEVLKAEIPVLVDFWAPWCGPCKMMLPIIEELSEEYKGKVKIVKVNVDENTEAPGKFNVMSIPTFILFKGGEPVNSFVGAKSKEDVKKVLDTAA